jgi:hypothetical protein
MELARVASAPGGTAPVEKAVLMILMAADIADVSLSVVGAIHLLADVFASLAIPSAWLRLEGGHT